MRRALTGVALIAVLLWLTRDVRLSDDSGWWLNLAGMLGVIVLAVPTFSLNFRKKTLEQIRSIVATRQPSDDQSALDRIAEELQTEAEHRVSRWRPIDEFCLWIGYLLLLGSSVLRVWWSA